MPPLSIMIKPASGSCNLRCGYCFYADEMRQRETAVYGKMLPETLEILVQKALSYGERSVTFTFQGGEPTLMGLEFFETFCTWKEAYNAKGLSIHCAIQTNGTLLDEAWAEFLARENFLVGISLDGPRSIHDKYRLDAVQGGTFQKALRAARLLECYGAQFNILTVLTEDSAREIERIYKFLSAKGFYYQQYIPCLDPLGGEGTGYSLTAKTYGESLKTLFGLWFEDICKGKHIFNRYFENLVNIVAGYEPESCDMKGHCSVQYVAEADGSIYPCDFYVLDQYKIGNIVTDSFQTIDENRNASGFITSSFQEAPECKACQWKRICRGGCRRNRPSRADGALLVSRFCQVYQAFFPYAIKKLEYLAGKEYYS